MEDRISTLPNDILCYILSFLPTTESVATCVLSKRWKHLWRSVPALDFNVRSYRTLPLESKFIKSMYAFIISRDLSQSLQRFSLHGYAFFSDSMGSMHFSTWLIAAAQSRVQHLKLELAFEDYLVHFPSAFLCCKTLVVLNLRCLDADSLSCVNLPSLKSLHLKAVCLRERACLAKLLNGCPNLEDFEAKFLSFSSDEIEAKFKRSPNLERALIFESPVPLEVVGNVQFLSIVLATDEQKLSDSSGGRFPQFYNLTHLRIDASPFRFQWVEVSEMLNHCHKLQKLSIINSMSYTEKWHCPANVPRCISLHLKTWCFKNYANSEIEFEIAKYIMKNASQLQDMIIYNKCSLYEGRKAFIEKLLLCPKLSSTCKLQFI